MLLIWDDIFLIKLGDPDGRQVLVLWPDGRPPLRPFPAKQYWKQRC